ncbi:MAG: hypothetical protein ABI920_14650 [Casimicrobiaceae bacterium]
MTMRTAFTAAMFGAGLLATLPLTVAAQDSIVVETLTATTYLNGGIGKDEEGMMRRVASEFPLRMTFSARKEGEFLADVPLVIADARGNPVFELPNAGPMLYVMLPDGKYRVSARFNGMTESQDITLTGKSGKDLNFNWKGKAQS